MKYIENNLYLKRCTRRSIFILNYNVSHKLLFKEFLFIIIKYKKNNNNNFFLYIYQIMN